MRGAPTTYWAEVDGCDARFLRRLADGLDGVHVFCTTRAEIERGVAGWRDRLTPAGALWLSWPKRSSGLDTDLDGNVVREMGLASGLVDVKVCAVDDTWSGLKFVRRLKDRAGAGAK